MTRKSDLKKHIRARQAKTGEAYSVARAHVLKAREASARKGCLQTTQSQPIEPERITAIVLKCNKASLRLQVLCEKDSLTLCCSNDQAWVAVPAQFVEVTLTKRWTWRDFAYASGVVERAWTDVPALGFEPIELHDYGLLDLDNHYEPALPPEPNWQMWAASAALPRRDCGFGDIAWGEKSTCYPEECLTLQASDIVDHDPPAARRLLMEALLEELRCIDAHVHLGYLAFDAFPRQAQTHYEIAVQIGELSLGRDFDGILLWGHLNNRPFLRALHGQALCLWRQGEFDRARGMCERMLILNPPDNQGIRFLLEDIRAGIPWESRQEV